MTEIVSYLKNSCLKIIPAPTSTITTRNIPIHNIWEATIRTALSIKNSNTIKVSEITTVVSKKITPASARASLKTIATPWWITKRSMRTIIGTTTITTRTLLLLLNRSLWKEPKEAVYKAIIKFILKTTKGKADIPLSCNLATDPSTITRETKLLATTNWDNAENAKTVHDKEAHHPSVILLRKSKIHPISLCYHKK